MDDIIKLELEKILNENTNVSMEEMNLKLQKIVNKYNNEGVMEFEGLSSAIMHDILYNPLKNNFIKINPNNFDGNDIPILMQIKYFINSIKENKKIKLTKAGNLPPVLVKDIYNKKFITDSTIESGIIKLTKETDVESIVMMRIICGIAGLIKKRHNEIVLCKNSLKEIESNNFLQKIMYTAFNKYNWAYFDMYENEIIGQFGNNYTLFILYKYGDKWRNATFYSKLYYKAFPDLRQNNKYDFPDDCYTSRTFDRMLKYFGFIEYSDKELEMGKIKRTKLFEKYIKIGMDVA